MPTNFETNFNRNSPNKAMFSSPFWEENFNTALTGEEERKFQGWIQDGIDKYGIDLSKDLETYDLRGFWKGGGANDEAFRSRTGHAPDTWKKPNHITFSNESVYHDIKSPFGGDFKGGSWINNDTFKPTKEMLNSTHRPDWYKPFMEEHVKGVKLLID